MEEILKKYKSIIIKHEIIFWDSEPTSYRFKAKISFINGSYLMIRDYQFVSERKYSFHWQDKNDNLITRWDNAEHWKDVETFPHHLHTKDGVFPSKDVSLEEIMDHIFNILITKHRKQ